MPATRSMSGRISWHVKPSPRFGRAPPARSPSSADRETCRGESGSPKNAQRFFGVPQHQRVYARLDAQCLAPTDPTISSQPIEQRVTAGDIDLARRLLDVE